MVSGRGGGGTHTHYERVPAFNWRFRLRSYGGRKVLASYAGGFHFYGHISLLC